jgi:dephospho-CoA kinase
MNTTKNLKIIAFVGLAGAGKSSAVEYLTRKDYPKVSFGSVVLEAMTKVGLEHTAENEKVFREALRAREGKDFIAKSIISQINVLEKSGQHRIIADGIYSWTEYKTLKSAFPGELIVVAIIASKHLRHRRLNVRPIRPLTDNEANQRDWAEIENLEKGGPIAIADYSIVNDSDLENLHDQIDQILDHTDF